MSEIEFLSWVRGPGFQIAVIIFVAGVIIRLGEILLLGRKTNLAEALSLIHISEPTRLLRRSRMPSSA